MIMGHDSEVKKAWSGMVLDLEDGFEKITILLYWSLMCERLNVTFWRLQIPGQNEFPIGRGCEKMHFWKVPPGAAGGVTLLSQIRVLV